MTPSTETLWAYAKGELSAQEHAQVKAMLDASPDARAALADVEASLSVLALLPEPPPMPDAMGRRIGAALADRVDAEASRSFSSWWQALFAPRFVFAAAAVAVLVLGVAFAWRSSSDGAGGGVPIAEVPVIQPPPLRPIPIPSKPVKAVVASVRKGRSGSASLTKAQVLESGATVSTEAGGSVWLKLPDGTKAGLTGASDVTLAKLEEKELTLDVTRGSLAMVVPHREDRLLTVRAGEVEVKDLGTRFLVSREEARVVVAVEEGSVEVKTPRSAQVVKAGRAVAWHDGELDDYAWKPAAPTEQPPNPTEVRVPAPVANPAVAPQPQLEQNQPPVAEDVDVEPLDEGWATPDFTEPPAQPPPLPVPDNTPPSEVVTVHPDGTQGPVVTPRRTRRGTGFNLKSIEDNLRELQRQAHTPFTSSRDAQARFVVRLADQGDCVGALDAADRWLSAPAGDATEELPLVRMVLQQKVRCLNRLGRGAEAVEVQRQMP